MCSEGGASGGGGLVHMLLRGAICSGGVRLGMGTNAALGFGSTIVRGCEVEGGDIGGFVMTTGTGTRAGRVELLPMVYGVCGGIEDSFGGTKMAGGGFVATSIRSSQSCVKAEIALSGRCASTRTARMNSPRI